MRIVYIISGIEKALSFEWIAEWLVKKAELTFILIGKKNTAFSQFLISEGIPVFQIGYLGKRDLFASVLRVAGILRKLRPDIVHTHLFEANLIGLTAAKLTGIKRRIYTRHHSTIHHIYHPSGVKWDRLCSSLATDIIAISENVRSILVEKERVSPEKIHLIHHGFKIEVFENVHHERIRLLHAKYNLQNKEPVIGVISRLTHWKGVQHIILAFEKLLREYPQACLILANATGDDEAFIDNMLKSLPPDSFIKIGFEEDVPALYQLFDIFAHMPIDIHSEAFGQIYVESLLAGIPSIFTLSGVAPEFIKDKVNALVVDYESPEEIYVAFKVLLADLNLRKGLVERGRIDAGKFNFETMVKKVEELYFG